MFSNILLLYNYNFKYSYKKYFLQKINESVEINNIGVAPRNIRGEHQDSGGVHTKKKKKWIFLKMKQENKIKKLKKAKEFGY